MPDSFATPCSIAHRVPLSMGFPRLEYWSGLPFLSQGDLPDPGTEPASPELQADSLPLSHQARPFIHQASPYYRSKFWFQIFSSEQADKNLYRPGVILLMRSQKINTIKKQNISYFAWLQGEKIESKKEEYVKWVNFREGIKEISLSEFYYLHIYRPYFF